MTERSCGNCKFAIFQDFGYSNYTVEGTDFSCSKGLHPDGSFDNWYGQDSRLAFGEKCDSYVEGEGVYMDVDHELEAELTPEQRAIWDSWEVQE